MKKKSKKKVLNKVQQRRILSVARRGQKVPSNWKLIHTEEVGEDEMEFNPKSLLTKLSMKFNFRVAVTSSPNEDSRLDNGVYRVRYRYRLSAKHKGERAIIDTSRDFCRTLISLNRLFRIEDINIMSFRGVNPMSKRNYSIFKYKGSYGCRHTWERLVFVVERDSTETGNNPVVDRELLS